MSGIVSLLPSATEIVCALGARPRLIGRSHECDFPCSVEVLPVCTEAKIRVDGDSHAIHSDVTAVLERDISVYRVHSELLRELQPQLIVTQVQCDVCAVSLRDVEAAIADWIEQPATIVALNPGTFEDVLSDIAKVGEAIETPAAPLIDSIRERIDRIRRKSDSIGARPRVATIEWLSPLMAAGNWMPELIEMAGGISIFGRAGEHSPWMEWSDLVASDPDMLVIMPCGFSIAQSERDLHFLSSRPEWPGLRAVRTGNVYIADGNQYFNRPGPRLAESVEILAEMFHPRSFDFGHRGRAWRPA